MSEALPPVVVEIIAKYDKLKAGLAGAAEETKAFESTSSKAFAGAAKVGKMATGALVVGAIAVGVEATKMASQFQTQTNLLVTAAGESATAVKDSSGKIIGGLDLVRKGILNIGSETGTSFEKLNEGMYEIEKAGIRGADGLKVLKAAAQGAAEEGADMGTVTNAMTSIMASYHLEADKSVGVMNALKTAAGGSKTTMEMFAGSLSTVLPIASAAGLDFAQVGGAIAALTRHGTSAAEATQELANTIRNLQAPNQVAVKELNQFGISSVELSQNLGKKGLGGTLEMLVQTIGSHTKNGQIMIDTFKQSKSAAQDLTTMQKTMTGDLAKYTGQLVAGNMTLKDYSKVTKDMAPDQAIMAAQFATLMTKSRGFSDALRSGSPQATTMANELKKMLGGSTGLNTALMITGENTAYLNEMTKKTGDSLNDGAKDVEGWESTSKLLSIQLAKLHQNFDRILITVGTKLIPVIKDASAFFLKHKDVAIGLAAVIGGALTVSIVAYVGKLVWGAGKSVWAFGKMIVSAAQWAAAQAASMAETAALWTMYFVEWVAETTASIATSAAEWAMYYAARGIEFAVWVGETLAGYAAVAAGAIASFIAMAAGALVWAAEMLVAGAMALLPFMPIILAVAAVGIAAYELYKHWDQVWGFIRKIAGDAWNFINGHVVHPIEQGFHWVVTQIRAHWQLMLAILTGPVGLAFYFIKKHTDAILGFFTSMPHKIAVAFSGLGNILLSPFRGVVSAINGVIGMIDGIHFSFHAPSWAGGFGWDFGGFGIPMLPQIPGLWSGGNINKAGSVVVGEHGREVLHLPQGAQVTPLNRTGGGGGGMPAHITLVVPVKLDGRQIAKATATFTRDELLQLGRGTVTVGLT